MRHYLVLGILALTSVGASAQSTISCNYKNDPLHQWLIKTEETISESGRNTDYEAEITYNSPELSNEFDGTINVSHRATRTWVETNYKIQLSKYDNINVSQVWWPHSAETFDGTYVEGDTEINLECVKTDHVSYDPCHPATRLCGSQNP